MVLMSEKQFNLMTSIIALLVGRLGGEVRLPCDEMDETLSVQISHQHPFFHVTSSAEPADLLKEPPK